MFSRALSLTALGAIPSGQPFGGASLFWAAVVDQSEMLDMTDYPEFWVAVKVIGVCLGLYLGLWLHKTCPWLDMSLGEIVARLTGREKSADAPSGDRSQ